MESVVAINITTLIPAQISHKDLAGDPGAQAAVGSQGGAETPGADQSNLAVLTTAQTPGSAVLALGAVTNSLNRATSISDVAGAAGQSVSDLLAQLKSLASSAADPAAGAPVRQSLDADFKGLLGQIQGAVNSASFDGVNLLNGSQSGDATFAASADGTSLVTLSATNLSLGGPNLTVAAGSNIATFTAAASALDQIDVSLTNVHQALETLTAQASQLAAHADVVSQVSGVLNGGASGLIQPDLSGESVRLQALQLQQQLAAQSAPIANQAPQALLSLLR